MAASRGPRDRGPERIERPGDNRLVDSDFPLVAALRAGREDAFTCFVKSYYPAMLNLALRYVPSRAGAEEVVHEAWLGILTGLSRFEGQTSFRTWAFRILINRAKSQVWREARPAPLSALDDADVGPGGPSVDPARFLGADDPQWPRHWRLPPRSWGDSAGERLLSEETQAYIRRVIADLPPAQRDVITLRDVKAWTAEEVSQALNLTDLNQRMLLHQARAAIRAALETHLEAEG